MEAINNIPNLSLQNAYEEINFYEHHRSRNVPVMTRSNGPADLAGFFANNSVDMPD